MDEYMAVGDHELDDFADREEITEELEALFEIAVDFSEGR